MKKTLNAHTAGQDIYAIEVFFIARLLSVFTLMYSKLKNRLLAFKDFVEYHSFFEGELTNTSGFDTKILHINKLKNK